MEAFKKPNIAIAPPTMLYIPKSEAPRAFKISRVVYSDTNIVIAIFAYKYPVFLITLFAVEDIIILLIASCSSDYPFYWAPYPLT